MTLVVGALVALIAYGTLSGPRYRLTVCMAYNGNTACRTVSAKSEQGAMQSAVQNACADIASGVTPTMNCEKSEPKSVRWLSRPR